MEKREGKRPAGRTRRRWEDNIKPDIPKWAGARTGLIWLITGTGGRLL